jgi:transposase
MTKSFQELQLLENCKTEGAQNEKIFNVRYEKKGEMKSKLLHSLLRCKTCNRIWNRDDNSSRNIQLLGEHIRDERERPQYLKRMQTSRSPVEPGAI